MISKITTLQDIMSLFPQSTEAIELATAQALHDAQVALNQLLAIPDADRTFANTAKELDRIDSLSSLALTHNALVTLEAVSPHKVLRESSHNALLKIREFYIDHLSNNRQLYERFKEYATHRAIHEKLDSSQRYYIEETIKSFEHAGLNLPEKERAYLAQLQKNITKQCALFDANIAEDESIVSVTKDELQGMSDSFWERIKPNQEGIYELSLDYPTYYAVMEQCVIEHTRKKMYQAFLNRAYPANDPILRNIIAQRNEYAQLLGFSDYATFDLDSQMAKSPVQVQQFLEELLEKITPKVDQEVAMLTAYMPESVTLTPDGKIKPWDILYLKNHYKKTNLAIDEEEIACYFPLENTLKGLLSIYEQFFSLTFKQVSLENAWDPELMGLEVYCAITNEMLGYILLDLYPRPGKYTHACHISIIPATYMPNGRPNKAASIVIANFPPATEQQPSLLNRYYVNTFFHEFGHALHAILGRTKLASFAGTSVKCDFVEMPSQMLEEWLWDKNILTSLSQHYKTGNHLPEKLIDQIIESKQFDTGLFVQRQNYYAQLALALFSKNTPEPKIINEALHTRIMPTLWFDKTTHLYASFGHLTGYGPKYYGYLWSKVFALDLFETIKKHGLLNPVIGKKYSEMIIGKGGSVDPNILLESFLSRKPNDRAFLCSLGITI